MRTNSRSSGGETSSPSLLFTAPHDFLSSLDQLADGFEVEFREAWTADALPATGGFRYWIPNPGQHFVIDGSVLDRYPQLAAIATPSTGSNHIDVRECEARGVTVYSLLHDREGLEEISASAEFTFLHVLNAVRRIDVGLDAVRAGEWRDVEGRFRGRELAGRSVGLVGCGRIGRRLARYFAAFGCDVTAYDPYVSVPAGVRSADDLIDLFEANDIVVVCCSLTEETTGMIGPDLVRRMRPEAVLVNTARGEILQERELATLLEQRLDLVFAADVVRGEVTGSQNDGPLVQGARRGRLLVTPHIAGATFESQEKAARMALRLLRDHELRDRPGREPLRAESGPSPRARA